MNNIPSKMNSLEKKQENFTQQQTCLKKNDSYTLTN